MAKIFLQIRAQAQKRQISGHVGTDCAKSASWEVEVHFHVHDASKTLAGNRQRQFRA
jgi:hypothetical protein